MCAILFAPDPPLETISGFRSPALVYFIDTFHSQIPRYQLGSTIVNLPIASQGALFNIEVASNTPMFRRPSQMIDIFRVKRYLPALLLAPIALAQEAPYLGKGTSEINGFGGISYGLEAVRGSFGGNYAYSLSKYVMPYAEVSYFPGINRDINVPFPSVQPDGTVRTLNAKVRQAFPFIDTHAGVHLRAPIPGKNWVPYGVIGLGAITNRSTKALFTVPNLGPQQITVDSESHFAINGGGGLRYYFKENFGIRIEAKVYKPTGDKFGDPFFKFVFGVFFYAKR
jgi:Outer membrane protein beta-barrel domain